MLPGEYREALEAALEALERDAGAARREAEPVGEAVARAARERSEQEREMNGIAAGRHGSSRSRYEQAVAVAGLAELVRGYEDVKMATVETFRAELAEHVGELALRE